MTFTVAAANAAGAVYLWFRNNVPMTDHASGMSAGAVSGSATPTLHLSQIMAADGAYYQCSVTTVCTAMSVQAMLTVSAGACCPADFNGVGGLNTQDIFDFLNAWFAVDPRADFNHVNGLNTQDIFDFLAAWFAGCP